MSSYFIIKSEYFPKPYHLLTIFSKSNWMEPKKRIKYSTSHDEKIITGLRKDEDIQFCRLLGLKPHFFGFKDCLLAQKKVVFTPNSKLSESLVKDVYRKLNTFLKRKAIKDIVFPFPAGHRQHYDHRIVLEVSKKIKSSFKYYVDDLPYSSVINLGRYNLKLIQKISIYNLEEKINAMNIYDSQMAELFYNKVREISTQNNSAERILKLRP